MRALVFLSIIILMMCSRSSMGKTGRTLFTDEQVRQARENASKYEWAKKSVENAKKDVQWVLDMPDEELWQFIPPAEQPRALNVRFGFDCPIHGKEIFKVGANYPWKMDREHPFKLICPVGGEVYPSNDYDAWNKDGKKEKLDTHQKYVDDGYGWVDSDGNHYWFVGYYYFWQRWRTDILPVIPRLAYVYLMTGDKRYSHKAAVMLAHIAQEYPAMDYTKQAYHNGNWPARCTGKILDLDWEGSGTVVPLSESYDQIYDALDEPELRSFLSAKGISDPREFIEKNFLQEAARCIEANIIHGNMNYQSQLATVATVLDNHDPARGFTTDQMVEWIMNGGGEMTTLLYNGVDRDGAGSEESIGYDTIWTAAFLNLAEKLKPLGYDLFANPRLKKMAEFYIHVTAADKFSPMIGDGGDLVKGLGPVWGIDIFRRANDAWPNPMYAKAFNRIGWPTPSVYDNAKAREDQQKKAKKLGTDLGLKTRNLGGYGLAVLEAGEKDARRALTLYYGSSGAWHGHLDRLNIEMWSHGRSVLPEMGYPAHWGDKADYWTRSTPSHYCVQIDENHQQKKAEGHLNLLAASLGVQVADASDEGVYQGIASLYRRTVAMVDLSPTDSYLIDVFRVKGGKTHDYLFHGLPFGEFSVSGVDLGPTQEKGTLMGEDIEFGKTFSGMKTGGYQFLTHPRRGTPDGTWSANWLIKKSGLGLKMTMLKDAAQEVIVTDAEPEAKPGYPDKMEWVLARNNTGSSTYLSVIEPYKDKPSIRRVTRMQPSEVRDDLAAVKVDSASRTDYILSALDSAKLSVFPAENARFQGEFGSISEDAKGFSSMMLVNGNELSRGDYAVKSVQSLNAKVTRVDYKNNSITLDRALPVPSAVVGQVIVLHNPQHSASYTVTKAEIKSGKTVLHFGDISLIEGIGELTSIDDSAKAVQTSSHYTGYGNKWAGKLLPGRAIVNEAKTDSWRISDYDNARFVLDASGSISGKFKDASGKLNRFVYIAEVSIGDEVMIPAVVSMQRGDEDTLQISSTSPFELTVPAGPIAGAALEYLSDGEWVPMRSTAHGNTISAYVSPEVLVGGKAAVRVNSAR